MQSMHTNLLFHVRRMQAPSAWVGLVFGNGNGQTPMAGAVPDGTSHITWIGSLAGGILAMSVKVVGCSALLHL